MYNPPHFATRAEFVLPGLKKRLDEPLRLVRDHGAIASSVGGLSTGLLRCHSQIAAEAADIFYRKNTFAFRGHHDYLPVISWLHQIGIVNRGYLTSLEISVRRPSKAWQLPDGTRLKGDLPDDFAPRHPHLSISSSLYPEGEVDMINPAFELIIHTLARSFHGAKITLNLDLEFGTIPGIELFLDQEIELFSMDLPNLIEKWRTDYTTVGSCRTLEILWKAEADRALFLQKRALIEEKGWEIVGEEAAERLQIFGDTESITFPTMRFLLKRRTITAPLMPAAPDPYSWKPRAYYVE
ncbi:MAG: hypothetical protein Q9184_007245 [Pyrenodesmia sp. 2 TL-2023]